MYYIVSQSSLSMGFSRQEYWSGLPFPSPENLPDPEIEPRSPALQADSLLTKLWGKPPYGITWVEPTRPLIVTLSNYVIIFSRTTKLTPKKYIKISEIWVKKIWSYWKWTKLKPQIQISITFNVMLAIILISSQFQNKSTINSGTCLVVQW